MSCDAAGPPSSPARRDNVAPLHEFTLRFSGRFKELVFDVDEPVAAAGLQLLSELVAAGEVDGAGLGSAVHGMLALESAPLRRAAAGLCVQLMAEEGRAALEGRVRAAPAQVRGWGAAGCGWLVRCIVWQAHGYGAGHVTDWMLLKHLLPGFCGTTRCPQRSQQQHAD